MTTEETDLDTWLERFVRAAVYFGLNRLDVVCQARAFARWRCGDEPVDAVLAILGNGLSDG